MDNSLTVIVNITSEGNKKNVNILFPSDQQKLLVGDTAHILAAGISLLIKTCTVTDTGIKDYELIEEIINHISTEFTSTESFDDAKIHEEVFKKHE